MDKKTNLDEYLADLGISETEDEAPPRPVGPLPDVSLVPVENLSPAAIVERFLRGLLSRIDDSLDVTVRDADDAVEAEITGDRASRLSGRDGRVLQAVEVMAYTVLSKHTGRVDLRVRVDAGGFRRRHAENLSRLAERLAVQVAKSGEPHELQPMSPSDRRIMHIALKEHPDVMTESVGEGSGRHLVIRPRHADPT